MTAKASAKKDMSRHIDALIHQFVFKKAVQHDGDKPFDAFGFDDMVPVPMYSGRYLTGWKVLIEMEKMDWSHHFELHANKTVTVTFLSECVHGKATHGTVSMAICLAALNTLGVLDPLANPSEIFQDLET